METAFAIQKSSQQIKSTGEEKRVVIPNKTLLKTPFQLLLSHLIFLHTNNKRETSRFCPSTTTVLLPEPNFQNHPQKLKLQICPNIFLLYPNTTPKKTIFSFLLHPILLSYLLFLPLIL